MIGWDDEIEISLPVADCFATAVDLDSCQNWIPEIQSIEKLYSGTLSVGCQWKETRREGKREHTMVLEAFEHRGPDDGEPPYIHSAGAQMKNMRSYYRFVFSGLSSNRTHVKLEARVEPRSIVMGLVSRLMVRYMKKSDADLLLRLKSYCEA